MSLNCGPMQRQAVLFIMLFAVLWQSLALARVGSTVNVLSDAPHTALHWAEAAHHHLDDGSYQVDDSKESAQHLLSDHIGASAALLATGSHDFAAPLSAAPGSAHETCVPNPVPEGLLRPPRAHA